MKQSTVLTEIRLPITKRSRQQCPLAPWKPKESCLSDL